MNLILSIYVFCSFYMTGVIWLIQLLNYPSLRYIHPAQFNEFHRRHTSAMSILVGPVMLAEMGCVLVLAKSLVFHWVIQAGLLAVLWLSTFLISVPIHNKLAKSHQNFLIKRLIKTNWIRTILWTTKAGLLFYMQQNVLTS